ncbi:MAG: mannose-1-phosphate guanylyltransferase [Thermincola sp.]|nr:mannose-1-phosphate guanylyltransferase [Thermincola sp.]
MVCVVIMAGGRGERFWPKSRAAKPKQFIDITGTGNMLLLTYRRVVKLVAPEQIFVVTGVEYKAATLDSLPELPPENIIIEPEGRNTAPCIGLAAVVLEKRFPGAVMVVVPADHFIIEEDKFIDDLRQTITLASDTGGLVTIGVRPSRPETGYGYLQTGPQVVNTGHTAALKVTRFVEKPDYDTALKLLTEGNYLWNAGIFVWKTTVILEAFENFLPEIYRGLMELKDRLGDHDFAELLVRVYAGFPRISIDYGIMEKAEQVYTIPGNFIWDDVGTWNALPRVLCADQDENILSGEVVALDSKNSIIDAGRRLVAVIGADNLVIVDTEDTTFVCHKNKIEMVRELLEELRRRNMGKYL